MMKKRVKHMARDAMYIGVAGVGLGAMAGVSGSAAPAIGVLGSGLGTAGSLVMVSHGIGMLSEAAPKMDGSGRGVRANKGRGGCEPPRRKGKGYGGY